MSIEYFSKGMTDKLRVAAAANLPHYAKDNAWLAGLSPAAVFRHETGLSLSELPVLQMPKSKTDNLDSLNTRIFYSAMKDVLSPVQAMDERLWACLCHTQYWDYMKARWSPENGNAVVRRFLFEGASFAALTRNGISRLWWFGHLTYDETRDDPFELTDILLSNQDIQTGFVERAIGKSRVVLHSALEYIEKNKTRLAEKEFGRRIQLMAKGLRLAGGVTLLDAMSKADIYSVLETVEAAVR